MTRDGLVHIGVAVDRDEAVRGLVVAMHRTATIVVDDNVTFQSFGDFAVSTERCEMSVRDDQIVVTPETAWRWPIGDPTSAIKIS
jgi:hypothetical protein